MALLGPLVAAAAALTLRTSASLPYPPGAVHRFLATPANWPRFVLSSHSVRTAAPSAPLAAGGAVEEIFGLPPLLPLRVRWECVESDEQRGALLLRSADGLSGVATQCEMDFSLRADGTGCAVRLSMSYAPTTALAWLAAPLLALDNALALKVLLRAAMAEDERAGEGRRGAAMDPIAGPLVKLARRLAVLPEEEADGWRGEPTAWAKPDSIPQKLSAWSATRLAGFKQWTAELAAGDFDAAAIDARLDREIGAHGVIMFSFSSCPFCKGAKELLDAKQAAYAVLELDEDEEGAALRARLGARTGRTSVPSVWIGGENCGGLNDGPGLAPLDMEGLLDPKLRAAGAISG